MTRPRPARLQDVARLAGCSVATVSRTLNTPELVSPELRDRIGKAAEQLKYLGNHAARALRSRRTRTVGAVIPTLNYSVYAGIVNALHDRLRESRYSLLVTTSEFDLATEFEEARQLLDVGAEALMLVGSVHDPRLVALLEAQHIPFACTYTHQPGAAYPCIGFDNYRTAKQIAEYLVSLGHREIAMISGFTANNDRQQARVQALLDTLEQNGMKPDRSKIVERPQSIADGRDALRTILAEHPTTTAIMCNTDVLAVGALAECRDLGIRVPEQLSVTGFGGLELAAHLNPPLTTVEVPDHLMGRRAGDALLRLLSGKPFTNQRPLDTNFIVRGSTAVAPRNPTR